MYPLTYGTVIGLWFHRVVKVVYQVCRHLDFTKSGRHLYLGGEEAGVSDESLVIQECSLPA
jgi:hypothetical protein